MMNKRIIFTVMFGGLLLIAALFLLPTRVLAEGPPICSTPHVGIPDAVSGGTPGVITDTLLIGGSGLITDMNISISATHTWVGDLSFTVGHVESGISVTVVDRPGTSSSPVGCSGDDIAATLDDQAINLVENECAKPGPVAIAGNFVPNNPLNAFDGEDMAGTWFLTAADNDPVGTGNLVQWCLIPTPEADLAVNKTVDNSAPGENDPISYTVTVSNEGPDEATGVVISDTLPLSLTFVASDTTQGSYDESAGLWQVGSLAASETATLTLEASANVGTVGQFIVNTAQVAAADQFDPETNNNDNIALIRVTNADLVITKTVSNEQPAENEPLIYFITVDNNGQDGATGVLISDTLPLSVTFAMSSTSQGSYDPNTGIWDVGKLQASNSATLTLMATVDPGTSGQSITNTAAIMASDQNDSNSENNISEAVFTVADADLAVSKTVNDPRPTENDTIVYTVAVQNNSLNNGTTGVIISDTLPLSLTLVATDTSQGSYDDSLGLWHVGSLTATQQATLTLTATVQSGTAGQIITNTAVVSASDLPDSIPGNNTGEAAILVTSADLAVEKTVNTPVLNENDPLTYTVTVSNLFGEEATGVVISDTLPVSVTLVASTTSQGSYNSGTGAWTLGSLAVSQSATLTLEALVDAGTAGQTITNTARVGASEQSDPDSLNNISSAVFTVTNAELAVNKEVDKPNPTEGEAILYTITLSNNGPDPATGVAISDILPLSVTLVTSSTTQGSYDSGAGLWDVGSLLATESATLTVEATVNAGTVGRTITNTAEVIAADQGDKDDRNNVDSAAITVLGTNLSVSKSDTPDPVAPGQVLTYTVVVTNSGPLTATNIVVNDTLPAGVDFISVSPDPLCGELGGVISCTLSSLDHNATATVTIVVTATTVGTVTNMVSVTGAEPDPDPGDNTASQETSIGAPAPGSTQIYLPVVVKE